MTQRASERARMQTSRPKLSDEQKAQLKTCFELMDADGSGAIDADELQDAFELLGLKLSRSEIQACDAAVTADCTLRKAWSSTHALHPLSGLPAV